MDQFILHQGDCLEVMRGMADNSVDSIVTDPPYHLTTNKKGGCGQASVNLETPYGRARIGTGFMGMKWDGGDIAQSVEMWAEAMRVLKPGGHLLSFSGSRTYHRMAVAIEDAGFEIRDQIMWLYGSGFPKSLDVSKAIDKAAGVEREVVHQGARSASRPLVEDQSGGKAYRLAGDASITAPATEASRQWQGWGTALKPAHEPICVARKPLVGTVAANVLEWGTGALNIDGCRVEPTGESRERVGEASQDRRYTEAGGTNFAATPGIRGGDPSGRWPANVMHDGLTEEWARFFYCAKASRSDRNEGLGGGEHPAVGTNATMSEREHADWKARNGNFHPTVKPTELMRYLVRMVTPPGGLVLDPFMGSGSTGKAALLEGFRFVGIDMTPEYVAIARARIEHAAAAIAPKVGEQLTLLAAE